LVASVEFDHIESIDEIIEYMRHTMLWRLIWLLLCLL